MVLGQPASPAVSAARLASYLIAALIGILLLVQAATGSWRLALLVLAALPVPVAAGILTAFALGTQDSLAAMAGLLGVTRHRDSSSVPGHGGDPPWYPGATAGR